MIVLSFFVSHVFPPLDGANFSMTIVGGTPVGGMCTVSWEEYIGHLYFLMFGGLYSWKSALHTNQTAAFYIVGACIKGHRHLGMLLKA